MGKEEGMSIRIKLLNKFLVNQMNLSYSSFDGRCFDSSNELVSISMPIFEEKTPKIMLIHKDKFLQFLEENDYMVCWTILGEKRAINRIGTNYPFSEFSGIGYFDSNYNIHFETRKA